MTPIDEGCLEDEDGACDHKWVLEDATAERRFGDHRATCSLCGDQWGDPRDAAEYLPCWVPPDDGGPCTHEWAVGVDDSGLCVLCLLCDKPRPTRPTPPPISPISWTLGQLLTWAALENDRLKIWLAAQKIYTGETSKWERENPSQQTAHSMCLEDLAAMRRRHLIRVKEWRAMTTAPIAEHHPYKTMYRGEKTMPGDPHVQLDAHVPLHDDGGSPVSYVHLCDALGTDIFLVHPDRYEEFVEQTIRQIEMLVPLTLEVNTGEQ